MTYVSAAEDLALHGARLLGFPGTTRIAGRYGLDVDLVGELLLDYEARGWVRHLSFAGTSGWSLTDGGRAENERRLAVELDLAGCRETVTAAHGRFRPLNHRFADACADWQIRTTRADQLAFNDHTDRRWDERVLRTLTDVEDPFRRLCNDLSAGLARFGGYAGCYSEARRRAVAGERAWVNGSDRDSCHLVWVQFHEDLLATLGIPRGADD